MFLFGTLGPQELILILLIVVIIFGAKKLPDLGKLPGRRHQELQGLGQRQGQGQRQGRRQDRSPSNKD